MTVEYRAGTPQRVALNQLIADLADRQAELSSETVKPAGWTWQPTGEKLGDWWARQDTTARECVASVDEHPHGLLVFDWLKWPGRGRPCEPGPRRPV